jgi:vancomycin resistance protein YoaR
MKYIKSRSVAHINKEKGGRTVKVLLIIGMVFFAQPVSSNVTLQYKGEQIKNIERKEFTEGVPGFPLLNEEKYEELVENIKNETYKPAIDAHINKYGEVVKEKTGEILNKEKFRDRFLTQLYGNDGDTIEIPMHTTYPKVDSELLVNIKTRLIGQYVTYFNIRNEARSHNIDLATEELNNTVVFPNETFSFNKTVGKRTADRGYLKAPVIVKGELAEDIGGGICQVSSTLFNAVEKAGTEIVERYSHSKRVTYVPEGRDATVSWYGPDFRFKNQYNQPILIRAHTYGSQMIVRIYSSEEINYNPNKVPNPSKELPKEKRTIKPLSY